MIRERDVSSLEVVQAHLARIEQHNPALNAVVTLDAEGALRQARSADASLASGHEPVPLLGVPVTLKDCHETAGMRTTAGYPPLADYIPERDGTIAARLRAAGAIILGKTNVSELLADPQSSNPVFGRTNNPWNVERTPGGSSGGAAAAVAACMTPLDIGSDIGGSVRLPAHCCGVFGFKPTEHRVSNHGHIPDLPGYPRTTRIMNCIGPLARSVDDVMLALRIVEGPDGFDTAVPPLPANDTTDAQPAGLKQLRIAWAPNFPGQPVVQDIRAAVEHLAAAIASHGGYVEEALPDIDFDEQLRIRATLRAIFRMSIDEPPNGPPTALDYLTALERRDMFIRSWEQFFSEWDALVCPVMMTTAFPHCERGEPVAVDGQPQPYEAIAAHCRPFNLTGHPAASIPVGLDRVGLPIGVQIVGPRWRDWRVLSIARAIAEISGPFQPPPGY